MTNEERAALIADLRGIVENRTKLAEDVKSIISEEVGKAVTKALGERTRSPMESFLTEADLRGPGDLPPGAESPISRRAPGMEYVVGVPPQTPVLRALKQPLFDTLIVPEDGIRDEQEIALFVDRKSFPDGRRKMRADCNLPCDQVLGYPLEYDFSSLELRFEKWAHPDDVRRVLRGIHLTWIFGQGTPWLRLTGSGFKPLFVLPHEVEDMRATIEQQVIKYAETGVWPAWTQDLTAAVAEERSRTLAALKEHGADSEDIRLPQGRARRISSTEAFSCRVACNVSEMHAPVRLKVMMQDTLYACL